MQLHSQHQPPPPPAGRGTPSTTSRLQQHIPPSPQMLHHNQYQQQQQQHHHQQQQRQLVRRHSVEAIGMEIHEIVATAAVNAAAAAAADGGTTTIACAEQDNYITNTILPRLQNLISQSPEAIFYQDAQHRTALHMTCGYQAPLKIVHFLIHQESLLLQRQQQQQQQQGNNRFPMSIQIPTTKGLLPLHYACREQASLKVIQCLIDEYPNALATPTQDGWLPLHMACARKAATPVIQYLLAKNPIAATQPTHCGRYALHFACANRLEVQAVQIVYETAPMVIQRLDKSEWNPLHVACAYSTLEVIAYLVEEWKDGLKVRGGGGGVGRLPLHLACSERQSLEIVVHLVMSYHGALHEFDANALLPLHAACKGGAPLEVIQFLIQEWPGSAFQLGHTADEIAAYILKRQKNCNRHNNNNTNTNNSAVNNAAANQLRLWLDRIVRDNQDASTSVYVPPPSVAPSPGRHPRHHRSTSSGGTTITSFGGGSNASTSASSAAAAIAAVAGTRSSASSHESYTNEGGGGDEEEMLIMGFECPPPNQTTAAARNGTGPPQPAMINRRSISEPTGGGRRLPTQPQSYPAPIIPQSQPFRHPGNSAVSSAPPSTTTTTTNTTAAAAAAQDPAFRAAGDRLHRACEQPQNLDVILQILKDFPQTIDYKAYGILPMHTACLNQAPVQVLTILHDHAPDAIQKRDGEGNLPIHLACYSGAPLESVDYLVSQWPECIHMSNANGDTALDRAKAPFYDNPDPEIIQMLERYEAAISVVSSTSTTATMSTITQSDDNTRIASSTPSRPMPKSVGQHQGLTTPASPLKKTFLAPMGVDEVRAALDAIRASKKASARKLELREEDEEEEEDIEDDEHNRSEPQQKQRPPLLPTNRQQIPPPPPIAAQSPASSVTASVQSTPRNTTRPATTTTTTTTTTPQQPSSTPASLPRGSPFRRIHSGDSANSGHSLQRASPFRGMQRVPSSGSASGNDGDSDAEIDPHQPAQRPGAVMVNEPGMRPDSAMYRAAYGNRGDTTTTGGQTSRSGSTRSFEPPPGVQEVREVVNALRQSQIMSRRQLDIANLHQYDTDDDDDDDDKEEDDINPNRGNTAANNDNLVIPPNASSFYQAALEESKIREHTANNQQHLPNNNTKKKNIVHAGYAMPGGLSVSRPNKEPQLAQPPIASSFYRAALAATENNNNNAGMPVSPESQSPCGPAGAIYSSFYRAAVEASEQRPNSVGNSPVQLVGPGQQGNDVPSSFYREALQAAATAGPGSPSILVGSTDGNGGNLLGREYNLDGSDRHVPTTSSSSSSQGGYYGQDRGASGGRPGIIEVHEPGMNPTSAMYRAAYRNPNARPRQYAP